MIRTLAGGRARWLSRGLVAVALAAVSTGLVAARPKDKDIDPNYLAMTDCPEEPGCPALILLDETEVNNEKAQARISRRRVVKVFTEEGIGRFSDIEVTSRVGSNDIRNLSGRTILPDGTVIPLKQDNIFVKTVLKQGRRRYQSKTAKFAGVVPGAIIDCSWDLVSARASNYTEYDWDVQKSLPVQMARLDVKHGTVNFAWQNVGLQQIDVHHESPFKNIDKFWVAGLPSIPDEPFGPPADAVRARVYLYMPELQGTWLGELAGRVAGNTAEYIGDALAVHEKLNELVAVSDPPIEKVRKIYRFVQEEIGSEEQRAEETDESRVADPENIDEVLARGYGDEADRTLLFVAMAKEAGLESAMLLIASRDETVLNTGAPDPEQFDTFAAAVKTSGSTWTFYDPAVRHCPFGMISARKEGGLPNAILVVPQKGAGESYTATISRTLIPRVKQSPYLLAAIPFSAAAKNVLMREATVAFGGDGTARVEVTDKGTGLVDLDHRNRYEQLTEEERRTELLDRLHRTLPRAKLVSAEFIDIGSFDNPATIKYGFTVDETGTAVGDRIILTPSIFDAGKATPFTSETRLTPVHFPHSQKTVQRIRFEIPEGYVVDEMPRSALINEGPFVLVTNYATDGNALVFSRRLEIDAAIWAVDQYPRLRAFFQKVQDADRQVIVLRKGSPS